MNSTLDSTTLVTAMLWLLALALPLAMLLWMAAQFLALRSLARRVRMLEGAAAAGQARAPGEAGATALPATAAEPVDDAATPLPPAMGAARSAVGAAPSGDDDRDPIDRSEGHA